MAEHGISFGKPKLDLAKLIGWKQDVVDKLTGGLVTLAKQRKVEVVTGVAKFTGPNSVSVDGREITLRQLHHRRRLERREAAVHAG